MFLFTKIFHIILCFLLILIILLQPGKDSSDVFGGGQSGNQRYAARSASNPLTKATTLVAVFFMFTSISLAWYSSESAQSDSNVDELIKSELEDEKKKEEIFLPPKLRNISTDVFLSTPPSIENTPPTDVIENTTTEQPSDTNTLEKIAEPVE